jgi:microsomal dipeptidase-like Zn-dependent dipeptidase
MFIDLHCHPSMKPFGQAHPKNRNKKDPGRKESIWHSDPPAGADIAINKLIGITRFSQSNFSDLNKGNFRVIVAALNPVEKGFFISGPGTDVIADFAYNWVSGIGEKKINFIQENKDDYSELLKEYDFIRQLHNKEVEISGKKIRYRLTKKFKDIEDNLNSGKDIISVVLSIEGAYTFINDNTKAADNESVLQNVDSIKKWKFPPFFVTISHHFDNKMSGHARSLPDFLGMLIDQTQRMDDGITDLGKEVIERLLSETNGKRIYIDIKHMSRKVRQAYYEMLDDKYKDGKIPLIVSHGAVNGRPEMNPDVTAPEEKNGLFNGRDINFYDDEIVRIAMSDGIFGLQIDERQITNSRIRNKIRYSLKKKKKKLKKWTGLIWNQIQYIAELLDNKELPAWDIISLGTDFDGIIDPVNGYWTSADIPLLRRNLKPLATDYLNSKKGSWKLSSNDIAPDKVLDRVFFINASDFLEKYYK